MIKKLTVPDGVLFKVGQGVIYHHGDRCIPAIIRGISRKGPKFQLEVIGNQHTPRWQGLHWTNWVNISPSLEENDNELSQS